MAWEKISGTAPQYMDTNGDPYSGAVLKAYAAGTTTNISMATSSAGTTTVSDVALNAAGFPEVSGSVIIPHLDQEYKLSLYATQAAADADSGAIWTIDNLGTTETSTEWVDSGFTPTFVSATSFTVSGDQTASLPRGLRILTTDSGGSDYCTILGSSHSGGTTTVLVHVDSGGSLDSGLSSLQLSILKPTGWSIPDGFDSSWDWVCPQGYIGGLVTSPNATDGDNDVDIAKGVCADYGGNGVIRLTSAITKQIDATWAAGSDAGGMFTGSVADSTIYAVWIIMNPSTGVVDAGFHTSFLAATAVSDWPTGYTMGQLIGYVYRRSDSTNQAWRQQKDLFRLLDIVTDLSAGAISDTTENTATIAAPPNCLASIYAHATRTGGVNGPMALAVYPTDAVDSGSAMPTGENWDTSSSDADTRRVGGTGWVLLDSSRQVHYRAREPTESPAEQVTVAINNFGCLMLTRGQETT